jgi:hypothetical protein
VAGRGDTDGDGITDNFEGRGDFDADGIPNLLDCDSVPTKLTEGNRLS